MYVRIVHFHNIFGPHGAWVDRHEKAPAALLRKALAVHMDPSMQGEFKIWEDGAQLRSFLYIDNSSCVEAILLLIDSHCSEPVNI
jgi:nucleoside-diphosphate-sugar epimerase